MVAGSSDDGDRHYRDNGFSSLDAMTRLHRPVVAAAVTHLAGEGGTIVDLGCGNGALLHSIVSQAAAPVDAFGVEKDRAKVLRKRPDPVGGTVILIHADLFDVDRWAEGREYHLALLAVSRLTEVSGGLASTFIGQLRLCTRDLLLYSYPDGVGDQVRFDAVLAQLGLEAAWAGGSPLIVHLGD
jgi:hypothetical protein